MRLVTESENVSLSAVGGGGGGKTNSEPSTMLSSLSSSESMYRSLKVVIQSLRGSLGVVNEPDAKSTSGTHSSLSRAACLAIMYQLFSNN